MPPMYLRRSRRYRLGYFPDEWEHAPPTTTAIPELYRRHACEVEVELTSQACHPAIKTGMTYVVGHFCSHIDWNSIPGSTGDHVAGASAAYENQALRMASSLHFSGLHDMESSSDQRKKLPTTSGDWSTPSLSVKYCDIFQWDLGSWNISSFVSKRWSLTPLSVKC